MNKYFRICLWVAFTIPAVGQERPQICEPKLATLTLMLGLQEDTTNGARVEIRRCEFRTGTGTLQIVAWKAGLAEPSLVVDIVSGGIVQMSMIRGVYAFEFLGGIATRLLVIEFLKGEPRVALDTDNRDSFVFSSSADRIVIEWTDYKRNRRRVEFSGGR